MNPKRREDIFWRVEKSRQQQALEGLEKGEDFSEMGTTTLIEGGQMHQLNLIGGLIWNLCDGNHSPEEIADELGREFEVQPRELLEDVKEFIENLHARGWLQHD